MTISGSNPSPDWSVYNEVLPAHCRHCVENYNNHKLLPERHGHHSGVPCVLDRHLKEGHEITARSISKNKKEKERDKSGLTRSEVVAPRTIFGSSQLTRKIQENSLG